MTGLLETRLRRIEARRTPAFQGIEVVFLPRPVPDDRGAFKAEHRARAAGKQIIFIEFVDAVPQP